MAAKTERIAYSVSEAAALSGYSRYILYERIKEGVLPAYRTAPDADYRIMRDDLLSWLTTVRVEPATKEEATPAPR